MADENQLSNEELRDVRKLLRNQDRTNWLWAGIKQVGLWITAVVVGVTHGWSSLVKLVKFLATQDPE